MPRSIDDLMKERRDLDFFLENEDFSIFNYFPESKDIEKTLIDKIVTQLQGYFSNIIREKVSYGFPVPVPFSCDEGKKEIDPFYNPIKALTEVIKNALTGEDNERNEDIFFLKCLIWIVKFELLRRNERESAFWFGEWRYTINICNVGFEKCKVHFSNQISELLSIKCFSDLGLRKSELLLACILPLLKDEDYYEVSKHFYDAMKDETCLFVRTMKGQFEEDDKCGNWKPYFSTQRRDIFLDIITDLGIASDIIMMIQFKNSPTKNDRNKDDEIHRRVVNTLICKLPDIKLDDIAGLTNAKDSLKHACIYSTKYTNIFSSNSECRSVLFYGPPGTGKTLLAQALANEAKSTFFSIKVGDIIQKYVGESEKVIRDLFKTAREKAPSIIFIDEVDSYFSRRVEGERDYIRQMKSAFLEELDGFDREMNNVFILGATNKPQEIDDGFLSRFKRKIYIPPPDFRARLELINIKKKQIMCELNDAEVQTIAHLTEEFTGRDITNLFSYADEISIRKLENAEYFMENDGNFYKCVPSTPGARHMKFSYNENEFPVRRVVKPPLTIEDFKDALRETHPTASRVDIESYEDWTNEHGINGA